MQNYFREIENKVKVCYSVAQEARKKGLDPLSKVEIPIARSLAERVVGLISAVYPQVSDPRIVKRITELEKQHGILDHVVALKIAEEIAKEKFCKFRSHEEAIDAGIRMGFAYVTVGVVASPLEGYTHFKIKKTKKGEDYMCIYYSGPIRSAGGTAASFSVILADHLREVFGYARYDPTEQEVKRSVIEIIDYHERITNLQYFPSEKEVNFIARNLPIQIDGYHSETKEVSNYKDLERIDTNFIRNGFCLVVGEGIAQKAHKLLKILQKVREKGIKLSGWDWLEEFVDLKNKEQKKLKETVSSATYISDIVAGRPVLSHPSRGGGFRLRYGKCRTAGLSSMAMHPLTMAILQDYIAVGTQLKYEGPGKSSAMSLCDDIEGPIIKIKDGSVVKIDSWEKAEKYKKEIQEVLFLGDFLVNYGEYFNRGKHLQKPGYCEDWYSVELEKEIKNKSLEPELKNLADSIVKDWRTKVSLKEAVKLSEVLGIPLYPKYIFYWDQISKEELLALIDWFAHAKIEEKIILPYTKIDQERFQKGKRALELLGAEHKVGVENVILDEETSQALLINLGIENFEEIPRVFLEDKPVLEIINKSSKFKIKDKSGTWIGARMGRPEKAKLRKLIGSPSVLFPVGQEGGRLRSVMEACNIGSVKSDFPVYYCEKCQQDTVYPICEVCQEKTKKLNYCPECEQKFVMEKCPQHNVSQSFMNRRIDIQHFFKFAIKNLGFEKSEIPVMIKGVRGTSSVNHVVENLAKGILRVKRGLCVNKDGTIRYDLTEMPLTHFKPKEIGTSLEKLKELGYKKDKDGKELKDEDQLIELLPQDVILPSCPETKDEKADDVFINITKYIDDLLVRFYKQREFYNVKSREDLIGHLVLGLAPHTSAGIVARIIGFSKTQTCLAHPMWHAAQRRDCFSYDTNIPIYNGKTWENIKIGEFVENLNPTEIVDNFGTLSKNVDNYKTLAYNTETKKVDIMPIKWFTKHSPQKTLKLSLENGREIKVTENHKFYVLDDSGNLIEKRTFELIDGDKFIVPYDYEVPAKDIEFLSLEDYFKDKDYVMVGYVNEYIQKKIKEVSFDNFCKLFNISKKIMYNHLNRDRFPIKLIDKVLKYFGDDWDDLPSFRRLNIKRNFVEFPAKIKVDNELMKIIGFYIAEGFSRKKISKKGYYQVDFAINEDDLRAQVQGLILEKFGLKPAGVGGQKRLTYNSRMFYEFFIDVLNMGEGAHKKRIPQLFLNLPKEKLGFLISAYFEGDGSVSKGDLRVACDTVSKGLIHDLEFVLARFGIYLRKYESEREPGKKVKEFYLKKNREIPKFKSTKLTIPSNFCEKFYNEINFISLRKKEILKNLLKKIEPQGMKIHHDESYAYLKILKIEKSREEITYCLNVPGHHNILANGLIAKQCEGDETCILLLLDAFINFSREYLPAHRGATQDAPLVATSILVPTEIDDMAFDIDVLWKYPLELYEAAEQEKDPWSIKITQLKDRLGTNESYSDFGFTHNVEDLNNAVRCSAYKSIPNMKEKVEGQMWIAEKLRSVDTADVARLVIDRHFIRDIKGNLRKFSQQEFRCVKCNTKFRRPPLSGKCYCGGRIIFTISEGGIIKYLEPALSLAEKYNVPEYVKQNLELTKTYIESIFGKETEKQETIGKWF